MRGGKKGRRTTPIEGPDQRSATRAAPLVGLHASSPTSAAVPTVMLDACVWHAAFVRHVLRHLALEGLVELRWTTQIEAEWIRSVRNARPEIPCERLLAARDRFRVEFPRGLVRFRQDKIRLPPLPDEDDAHVIKAAVAAQATVICSVDRHGFPAAVLLPLGLTVATPDALCAQRLIDMPGKALRAMETHRLALQAPSLNAAEYGISLRRAGLPQTSDLHQRLIRRQ